ncbi:MAG TPA: histidine phosphatase family protein [Solirubrobacterales bacterium]|jgi:probable phosphoglycerate mutase
MNYPHAAQQRYAVPPRATRLLLVRHGAAAVAPLDGEPLGLLDGFNDPPLAEEGRAQAVAVCARLALDPPDRIFVSGLHRTVETAAPLVEATGLEPVEVPELREIRLGEWEHQYPHRVAARDPLLERIEAEQRWDVIPGAESAESFAARVATGIEQVIAATSPGATAAVFVHGGVISELISIATGSRPLAFLFSDNTSLTELVKLRGERWMMRSFNDTAHLDG